MTRATLAIVAAFAAIVATAETSRTATENWTRNRIGEATNATLKAAKEYADAHVCDVQSVNGKTGTVVLAAADVHALPDTYEPPEAPVQSVNGKTGAVLLDAADVHALPETYTPPPAPVQSVNSKTGAVLLNYEDVGAWNGRYEVAAALALGYYGRTWIGGTPPYSLTWNTSEKRYRAQWAVGEIPTYAWLAYLSDLEEYVPTSRKVNGKPLTSDITIEGMTDNAAVLTNGALKTKSGTAITAGHVGAATPQQVTAAIAAANDYTDRSISSTNETFAAAVRATEIETEEEGSAAEYGTVGSAILALIAAVAALRKAAWSDAETNAMAQMFRADEELAGCETVQDVALAKLSQLLGEQIATN